MDLPPVYEVMHWEDRMLKNSRSTGTLSGTLRITAALDGRDAALGSFLGTANAALEWSFR